MRTLTNQQVLALAVTSQSLHSAVCSANETVSRRSPYRRVAIVLACYILLYSLTTPYCAHNIQQSHTLTTQTTMNSNMHSLCFITIVLSLASHTFAHVQMQDPPPIRSPKDPNASYQNIDYNYAAPLNPDGSDYPCKGYQKEMANEKTVATYGAGSTYEMTLTGSATHSGGSCQISLSYDNGNTFKVIKSMIGGCPLKETYNFTIPPSAPSGDALIAWTWANEIGNREFYMNCALVEIDGSSGGSLDSLPDVWVANIEAVNTCATTEGENPVFPHPGPDIEYGGGKSISSPSTSGDCEAGRSSGSSSGSSNNSDSMEGMFFENPAPASSSVPAVQPVASAAPSPFPSASSYAASTATDPPHSYSTAQLGEFRTPLLFVEMAPSTVSYTTVNVYESSCSPLPDVTITIITTTITATRSSSTLSTTLRTTTSSLPTPPTGTTPPFARDTSIYLPCIPGYVSPSPTFSIEWKKAFY